jgi:hypothetical protein
MLESEANRQREHSRVVFGNMLWIVSIVAWLGLVAWVVFDPQFGSVLTHFRAVFGVANREAAAAEAFNRFDHVSVELLAGILVAAGGSLLGILLGLFGGARKYRGMRAWLAFMALAAAWLTLLVGWREVAWLGQRVRLHNTIGQFDAIAQSLREDWPTSDGERDELGSFMAYPQGNPRMLMMLVSKTDPQVSAIERADDGSLGFEIRGEQPGTWLEWHPPGSQPATFVGGLDDDHDLNRVSPLGDGWYQVRYGQLVNESSDSTSSNHR